MCWHRYQRPDVDGYAIVWTADVVEQDGLPGRRGGMLAQHAACAGIATNTRKDDWLGRRFH